MYHESTYLRRMKKEYTFKANVIADNRITIPKWKAKEWGLNVGDIVVVTIKKQETSLGEVMIL